MPFPHLSQRNFKFSYPFLNAIRIPASALVHTINSCAHNTYRGCCCCYFYCCGLFLCLLICICYLSKIEINVCLCTYFVQRINNKLHVPIYFLCSFHSPFTKVRFAHTARIKFKYKHMHTHLSHVYDKCSICHFIFL